MKKNLGSADRVIRVIIAVVIALLYFTNILTGTLGLVLLIVGIVFLLTSFVSFCPIYGILGLSSNKSKKEVS